MSPQGTKSGVQFPPPPRAPQKPPRHSQLRARPHPSPPLENPPKSPLRPPPSISYLPGGASGDPPGFWGAPGRAGPRSCSRGEEKKFTARTLPGEGERGGGSAQGKRRRKEGETPQEHPPGGAAELPGVGSPHPGVRCVPPQRSPLWSWAGPFRVSSDISRDGIQGKEPKGLNSSHAPRTRPRPSRPR